MKALTATVIAIALILLVPTLQAFASEVEIIDLPAKTWILLIAPGCSFEDSDDLRHRLNYNNTAYEAYLQHPHEVVCMGGVDVLSIESETLPLLRSVFPSDAFVFAYSESQERDYRLYVSANYGAQYYRTTDGNAKIELGYGFASADGHIDIQHERAHLENCSAHLAGSNPYDVSTWTRMIERPWCMEGL